MAQVFSLDDVFAASLGIEIAGAYVLGRGLLVSPAEAFRRSQSRLGFHAGVIVAQLEDRVDAVAGLTMLGFGFLLQAIAYALDLLRVSGGHGWGAALVAVGITAGSAAVAYNAFAKLVRHHQIVRLVVEVAHLDVGGTRHDLPSAILLHHLGQELGHNMIESEASAAGVSAYAARVFGITATRPDANF